MANTWTNPGNGFKFHVGTKQLQESGRKGGRATHGESIVYIDGKPYSLQRLAKQHGLTVGRLYTRWRKSKDRGDAITIEDLVKPLRQQRKPRRLTETERLRRLLR